MPCDTMSGSGGASHFFVALILAQRRLCAAAIFALLFADIVRLGVATLASPLTLAQRAL